MDKRAEDTDSDQTTHESSAQIKAHVVPAVAGIQSADKATGVLYELADSEESMTQKDAQESIDLARQALTMALDRTAALDRVAHLSSDDKDEAQNAVMKLREARTALQKIDKKVSNRKTRVSPEVSDQIREQAQDVHTGLSEAESSLEQIAKAYDVKTDLEFGG